MGQSRGRGRKSWCSKIDTTCWDPVQGLSVVGVASGESLPFRISVSPPEEWGMGSTPVFLIVL